MKIEEWDNGNGWNVECTSWEASQFIKALQEAIHDHRCNDYEVPGKGNCVLETKEIDVCVKD